MSGEYLKLLAFIKLNYTESMLSVLLYLSVSNRHAAAIIKGLAKLLSVVSEVCHHCENVTNIL